MLLASLALMLLVPQEGPPTSPERVAEILASGDGLTPATAYKVKSVHEEYEILRSRNLRPGMQSLIVDGDKSFDLLEASDPRTHKKVRLYFDISSFFGHELDG